MVIGNISILLKDQARCGRGRSSRRDDDDDRHIREQEGGKIKDDGYRDADGYRDRQSVKGDHKEGTTSRIYHPTRQAAECPGTGHW